MASLFKRNKDKDKDGSTPTLKRDKSGGSLNDVLSSSSTPSSAPPAASQPVPSSLQFPPMVSGSHGQFGDDDAAPVAQLPCVPPGPRETNTVEENKKSWKLADFELLQTLGTWA